MSYSHKIRIYFCTLLTGIVFALSVNAAAPVPASLTTMTIAPDGSLYLAGTNATVIKIKDDKDKFSSRYYYDQVGRLVLSQNSKQYKQNHNTYSYTLYDNLGRPFESGQVTTTTPIESTAGFRLEQVNYANFKAWIEGSNREQVTRNYYDSNSFSLGILNFTQENLRLRVSSVAYYETFFPGSLNTSYINATHYSYDIHGNVKSLIQENRRMPDAQIYKRIDYDYDLISGKVNQVSYQQGQPDQYLHHYTYDADNRIVKVETSNNGIVWSRDAEYKYYPHGPLERVELGEEKVQGLDYVYTLQSWIKGVNNVTLQPGRDPGNDGDENNPTTASTAQDAMGYNLEYYQADYKSIDNKQTGIESFLPAVVDYNNSRNLYNGNISAMSTAIVCLDKEKPNYGKPIPQRASYQYDQLNRLTKMSTTQNIDIDNNQWNAAPSLAYQEQYTYDANGNIKTLKRKDDQGTDMDDLNYIYENTANGYIKNTNRLRQVTDLVNPSLSTVDIDNQDKDNYKYDELGNLISDKSEGIDEISWTVTGKVKEIRKSKGDVTRIFFDYDAMGNRISKIVYRGASDKGECTFYVRDASGNMMATYQKTATDFKVSEQYIYGSQRLGYYKADKTLNTSTTQPSSTSTEQAADEICIGCKRYELTNHLGNVLAVISDRKIPHSTSANGTVDYYTADIISSTDYYPFGMPMPERNFESAAYRFGFNGKENDNETQTQNYGFRIYNPSLGRFLSVDPLYKDFPWWTPYQFAGNTPIQALDLDGLEILGYISEYVLKSTNVVLGNGTKIPSYTFYNRTTGGSTNRQLISTGWYAGNVIPNPKPNNMTGNQEIVLRDKEIDEPEQFKSHRHTRVLTNLTNRENQNGATADAAYAVAESMYNSSQMYSGLLNADYNNQFGAYGKAFNCVRDNNSAVESGFNNIQWSNEFTTDMRVGKIEFSVENFKADVMNYMVSGTNDTPNFNFIGYSSDYREYSKMVFQTAERLLEGNNLNTKVAKKGTFWNSVYEGSSVQGWEKLIKSTNSSNGE